MKCKLFERNVKMSKTMKNLVIGAVAAVMASATSADTLYWMVTETAGAEFDYAQLYYTTTTTEARDGTAVMDGGTFQGVSGQSAETTGIMKADLGRYYLDNPNITGFYVEWAKYNGSMTGVTASRWVAISDALSSMDTFANGGQYVTTHTSTLMFVPEPTSGLLMLLGFGVLGLRRRRRV